MENPGSITVVKAKGSSDDFSEIPKYHTWDWNYHTEERAEQRLQSHKAVFAVSRIACVGSQKSSTECPIQHGANISLLLAFYT
jgi:hypothetical protein